MPDETAKLDVRFAARIDRLADEVIETRRALFALVAALSMQRLDVPKLAIDFESALERVGVTPNNASRELRALLKLVQGVER